MNCETCHKANPINRCTDSITLYVSTPDIDYSVVITDTATGRVDTIETTAVGDELAVDTSTIGFLPNHTYKIEVFVSGDFNDKELIILNGESACCVEFETKDYDIGTPIATVLSIATCG